MSLDAAPDAAVLAERARAIDVDRVRRGLAPLNPHLTKRVADPVRAPAVALGPDSPLRRPPRAPRSDEEHALIQVPLFTWAAEQAPAHPELEWMFAVPNWFGASRGSRAAGGRAKAEGRKPGVPDVILPAARGGWFGLYLEHKALEGTLSRAQVAYARYLRSEGYRVDVSHSLEASQAILLGYLGLPRTVGR